MLPPTIPTVPFEDVEILDSTLFPEAPTLPETILEWFPYFWELFIYIFSIISFVIRAVVLGVANIISNFFGLVTEINKTLSFLPHEILAIIEVSIVIFIVLKIINR